MFFGRGIIHESESNFELPTELPLQFLKDITNDFSDERKIAGDPFGTLYKGIVPDNGRVIAVRKLQENAPMPADKNFKKEIENMMALKHENIVRLFGFCNEAHRKLVPFDNRYIGTDITELLLCYEFYSYGNLQENLFGIKVTEHIIDWNTRFQIIRGICLGLLFLHKLDTPIIHMDLKLENIWLGENLVPKIGNFALARILGQEQTRLHTQTVVGSYGYMAPEYLYRGEISAKSDIYSLGLMIIEIATREKYCPENDQPSARKYIEKVQNYWTQDHIETTYSSWTIESLQKIRICIDIGLKCVEIDPKSRPSIEAIIDRLSGLFMSGS